MPGGGPHPAPQPQAVPGAGMRGHPAVQELHGARLAVIAQHHLGAARGQLGIVRCVRTHALQVERPGIGVAVAVLEIRERPERGLVAGLRLDDLARLDERFLRPVLLHQQRHEAAPRRDVVGMHLQVVAVQPDGLVGVAQPLAQPAAQEPSMMKNPAPENSPLSSWWRATA